jgi:hypothetical protein
MNEGLKLSGEFEIHHYNKKENKITIYKNKNVICYVGKERIAKLIGGLETGYFLGIAIGTGTSTSGVSPEDTALFASYATAPATITYESGYVCKFYHRFNFTETVTITEGAVGTALGIMLGHAMFSPAVENNSGDYMDVYYRIWVG